MEQLVLGQMGPPSLLALHLWWVLYGEVGRAWGVRKLGAGESAPTEDLMCKKVLCQEVLWMVLKTEILIFFFF